MAASLGERGVPDHVAAAEQGCALPAARGPDGQCRHGSLSGSCTRAVQPVCGACLGGGAPRVFQSETVWVLGMVEHPESITSACPWHGEGLGTQLGLSCCSRGVGAMGRAAFSPRSRQTLVFLGSVGACRGSRGVMRLLQPRLPALRTACLSQLERGPRVPVSPSCLAQSGCHRAGRTLPRARCSPLLLLRGAAAPGSGAGAPALRLSLCPASGFTLW